MDGAVLKKIQLLNWLLTSILGLAAWSSFSPEMAKAVLIGGIVAAGSFGWLKRDLTRLFSGTLSGVKGRFFIKYYARLAVLVGVLFWLVKFRQIHTLGILVGLSVVLLSVAVTMLGEVKKIYLSVKEAS
jgi:hypothetical protein